MEGSKEAAERCLVSCFLFDSFPSVRLPKQDIFGTFFHSLASESWFISDSPDGIYKDER